MTTCSKTVSKEQPLVTKLYGFKVFNPFPNKHCLLYKYFANTMGKREIARDEQFLLFPQCFLPVLKTFSHFYQI